MAVRYTQQIKKELAIFPPAVFKKDAITFIVV